MVGSGRGGWLTFALENYLWSRRRLRTTALAVAQRATPRSGGSAISGFSCCSPLNSAAAAKRGEYNRELYDLPTIDHVGDGLGAANFAICSWRVNDAKHVQTFDEFVEMCRLVVTVNEKNADVLTDAPKSLVGREF
jgi:hypothetical protein